MCVVENSGRFGGTYAAPIVSLMIEKYLNDTIAANRRALEERMAGINLIPPMMLQKMRSRDSLQRAKQEEKGPGNDLINIKDTLQSEDNLTDAEIRNGKTKNDLPAKDSQNKKEIKKEMMAPDRQRLSAPNKKDSLKK
jgi:hypothetical protein